LLSFCRVRDSIVDCVNVSPSARVELNRGLRDAQNVCAPTKVGTVLKINEPGEDEAKRVHFACKPYS